MNAVATAPLEEKHLWTYEEWDKLPEPELFQPTEIWNGELMVSPGPTPNHQRIVANIWEKLKNFAKINGLGATYISPLDVILSEHRVVEPDVFFVSNANASIVGKRVRGAPDLMVEVTSPGSWRRDRIDKKELYAQYGVKEYWIVDPEARTIEVFALTDAGYKLHSKATDMEQARSRLLDGLTISFREIEL